MHIKQIIVEGFKSYLQKTIVEFDPKYNVVVGKNGSGKSNFFLAMQIVLSREFIPLKKIQREGLINERPGIRSASVEIIFDNADKRLPIDKESVSVKRIINSKNDQFFLNGEKISATDMLDFLEIAGFTNFNQYYIIKQGKINELALKSETRLQLLYDSTGITFYKKCEEEFETILQTMLKKKIIIENILDTIDEQVQSLKEDTEQFKQYKLLYQQNRVLQFVTNERILNDNNIKLNELEEKYDALNKSHVKIKNDLKELQESINISNRELKKMKNQDKIIQDEKQNLQSEEQKLLNQKNQLNMAILELNNDIIKKNQYGQEIDNKLQNLNNLINKKEKKLGNIQSQCEQLLIEEEKIKTKLDVDERKRLELYKKQDRGSKFKNKEERDLWIKQELQQLEKQIEDKNDKKLKDNKEINDAKKECANLEKTIEEIEMKVLINQEKKLKVLRIEFNHLKERKDEHFVLNQELFKKKFNYSNQLKSLKDNVAKLEQKLNLSFGKSIIDGNNSVQKVLEIFKHNENMTSELTKYCGRVIENFTCTSNDIFKIVERTAGKQLFYHIVETHELGKKILTEMNRQQFPGEVTFLALDCLTVKTITYPKNENSVPLIFKLQFNDKYKRPLRKIFGRTLICRDLEVATKLAKMHDFDCMTLQGDSASSKGFLTGGHLQNLHSPMQIQNDIIGISEEISLLNEKINSVTEEMERNTNEISLCLSKQQSIEVNMNKISKAISDTKSKINFIKEELENKHSFLITKEQILKECEKQLEAMLGVQKHLNEELHRNMTENLSIQDQQQLENLNDSIMQLSIKFRKIYEERNKLEFEKNELKSELTTNLLCQKSELEKERDNISLETIRESLNSLNNELKQKETEVLKIKDHLKIQDRKANELHEQIKTQVLEMEKLQLDEKNLLQNLAELAKKLARVTSEIDIVEMTISKSPTNQFELANQDKELYEEFTKKTYKELHTLLSRTINELKKYDHINENVFVTFNTYNDKQKSLLKRKMKIDRACIKIQELIHNLQIKKCEVIEFMLDEISKNFTDIFKTLVQHGNAYLVMKTDDHTNRNDTESRSEASEQCRNLIGIDIMASFTESGKPKEINHLSGGQKSLLSLALTFAIQKCKPAPLYLFDEIDKALDADHRDAVSKMILERSQTAQFIAITHRPEFMKHASKFHSITFRKKHSFIQTKTYDDLIDK